MYRRMIFFILLPWTLPILLSTHIYSQNKPLYGYSSWYGSAFHGKRTASGEIFDMYKQTAAHKTLPFGTYLKVTNMKNKKSTIVKVNDRGPFKPNRIIDVSKKVAQILGFEKKGLALVKIDILGQKKINKINKKVNIESSEKVIEQDEELSLPKEQFEEQHGKHGNRNGNGNGNANDDRYFLNPPYLTPEMMSLPMRNKKILILNVKEVKKNLSGDIVFKIQFGAYKNIKLAFDQYKEYNKKGISTLICVWQEENSIYRILSKKSFKHKEEAEMIKQRLKERGMDSFIVPF